MLLVTLACTIGVPIALRILTELEQNGSLVVPVLRNFFWGISRFDPLSYVSLSVGAHAASTGNMEIANPDFGFRITILFLMFVVYSAIAIVQWRRVEA